MKKKILLLFMIALSCFGKGNSLQIQQAAGGTYEFVIIIIISIALFLAELALFLKFLYTRKYKHQQLLMFISSCGLGVTVLYSLYFYGQVSGIIVLFALGYFGLQFTCSLVIKPQEGNEKDKKTTRSGQRIINALLWIILTAGTFSLLVKDDIDSWLLHRGKNKTEKEIVLCIKERIRESLEKVYSQVEWDKQLNGFKAFASNNDTLYISAEYKEGGDLFVELPVKQKPVITDTMFWIGNLGIVSPLLDEFELRYINFCITTKMFCNNAGKNEELAYYFPCDQQFITATYKNSTRILAISIHKPHQTQEVY